MLQSMFATLDGRLLEMTRTDTGENINRLFGHVEGIYLVLLPIFALFPKAETLLVLQSLALSAGGIAVYWNARQAGLERTPALFLAYAFWSFPYLANIAMADFHSDVFMIFPHLLAWYCYKRDWHLGFWLCILLGALCKEYASVFNFALACMIFPRHRKMALGLIALALGYFFIVTPLVCLWVVRDGYHLQLQQHAIPQSLMGILQQLTGKVFTLEFAINTLSLLLFLNITLFRYIRGFILILPIYVGLTLANPWGIFSTHRHAMLMAPLFILLIEGLSRLPRSWHYRQALWGTLAPSVLMMFFYPGSLFAQNLAEMTRKQEYRNPFHYQYTFHDQITDSLLRLIPPGIPVASDYGVRTKLANRRYAFVHPFPIEPKQADFFLFDFFETLEYSHQEQRRQRCAALLLNSDFSTLAYVDGILILSQSPRHSMHSSSLKFLDSLPNPELSFHIEASVALPWSDGFELRTRFIQGRESPRAQAIVSFWISPEGDSLRVLHLPTYTQVDLRTLAPGRYEESFFFQIPKGKSLRNRQHHLALYSKDDFLPFFSRPQFLVKSF